MGDKKLFIAGLIVLLALTLGYLYQKDRKNINISGLEKSIKEKLEENKYGQGQVCAYRVIDRRTIDGKDKVFLYAACGSCKARTLASSGPVVMTVKEDKTLTEDVTLKYENQDLKQIPKDIQSYLTSNYINQTMSELESDFKNTCK